jgi:hypothetical protein
MGLACRRNALPFADGLLIRPSPRYGRGRRRIGAGKQARGKERRAFRCAGSAIVERNSAEAGQEPRCTDSVHAPRRAPFSLERSSA